VRLGPGGADLARGLLDLVLRARREPDFGAGSASAMAQARPMPRPAPVTSAVRPVEAEAPEPFASCMNGRLKRPLGDLFGLSKALIRRRLDAYAEHSGEATSNIPFDTDVP